MTDGYYKSYHKELLAKGKKGGRWEPWDATHDLVVKRILNPIPLYAKRLDELKIPAIGVAAGFDLEVGDWVAPHGKGMAADLFFKLERNYTSVLEPFDATLTVTFPKPDDGIQTYVAPPFIGSELRLPHRAPQDGYRQVLLKRSFRKSGTAPIEQDYRDDNNWFFRVRTERDRDTMTVAFYGKINGDIAFWPNGVLRFTYYFNPTPNDRNLEFDPKKEPVRKIAFGSARHRPIAARRPPLSRSRDETLHLSFFKHFAAAELYHPTQGSGAANNYATRSKMLAEALPALSFATVRASRGQVT